MWRPIGSAILLAAGCVLAPLSVTGAWARTELTNTDRYVETVAPLASDPAIQGAVTDRVTNEIVGRLDLDALIGEVISALAAQGLPPRAADALPGLAGSLESGVRGFVHDEVARVVGSDAFARAWSDANRLAHGELVTALSGEASGPITVRDGTVAVDLSVVTAAAKQRLVDAGFTLAGQIPAGQPELVLIHSDRIDNAQTAFRLVERLGLILPVVTLALLALGVIVAADRRRALLWAGLGLAISMVALAAGLAIGRGRYLDRLPASVSAPAAADLFDTVTRFLRSGLRTVLVCGLVVAAAAFLAGPSALAGQIRSGFRNVFGRAAGSAWVYEHRGVLRVAAAAIAGLVFVFLDHPSAKTMLLLAALTLVAFAVIELLAGRGNRGTPDHHHEAAS